MKYFVQVLTGPKLYKIYRDGSMDNIYTPGILEKCSDQIITLGKNIWSIAFYTLPICCVYVYYKGIYNNYDSNSYIRVAGAVGCLMTLSFLVRGLGRSANPKYMEFLRTYNDKSLNKVTYLSMLRKYDFDFTAWPVTYDARPETSSRFSLQTSHTTSANLAIYEKIPIQFLAYMATHTFGLRMVYPGSLAIINYLFDSALMIGRTQLVEEFKGKRAKVKTVDNNIIDTMFVDNRNSQNKDGEMLVICCEGNSGFYEVGIMSSPIKAGYSALGWNHPGFAWSTGKPYPTQEQNAIDAVMQYAINELGFESSQIVLFGWSIGGYTAAWAAVNYPDIKALILDATFDDLLPLALNQMPPSWNLLVTEVIRSYIDLNISELVANFAGPIMLVRRTQDEIICLRQGHLSTNRGNNLLLKIIETRHSDAASDPDVLSILESYIVLSERQRQSLLSTQPAGKRIKALSLIQRYMSDYNSTHCTPLPENQFKSVLDNFKKQH